MNADFVWNSRRTPRLGTATLGGLALLITQILPGLVGTGECTTTSLRQRLASATVLRTLNQTLPVRGSSVARNCLGLVLDARDSSTALVCDFDGAVRFRRTVIPTLDGSQYGAGKYGGIGGIVLSEDGSTIVLSIVSGYESYGNEVYSIDGTLLFAQREAAALGPSPHGRYFCTAFDEINTYALAILDRMGRQIQKFRTPRQWNFEFWNDDTLVVVDKDTLRFIESATGRVYETLPLNFERVPLFHSRNLPHLVLSRPHRALAVYDERNLLIVSAEGMILRRQVFPDLLCAVAFDDSLPQMVMQLRDWPATYGYFLSTPIDRIEPKTESFHWTRLARSDGPQNFPALWLDAGVIAYWANIDPSGVRAPLPAVVAFAPNSQPTTLFLTFAKDMSFPKELIEQPGFYYPVDHVGQDTRYLLASESGTVKIVSVESASRKDTEDR